MLHIHVFLTEICELMFAMQFRDNSTVFFNNAVSILDFFQPRRRLRQCGHVTWKCTNRIQHPIVFVDLLFIRSPSVFCKQHLEDKCSLVFYSLVVILPRPHGRNGRISPLLIWTHLSTFSTWFDLVIVSVWEWKDNTGIRFFCFYKHFNQINTSLHAVLQPHLTPSHNF